MSLRLTLALVLVCASGRAGAGEAPIRLTPAEIKSIPPASNGAGTSGVAAIETRVLSGNPDGAGIYTIELTIPPHTIIKPHRHRDDRIATVISGRWFIGYGNERVAGAMKSLPPGSFYTEPAGMAHFAVTEDLPAVVDITGLGPSDTVYVNSADDPSHSHR